jgi:putative ABC transport system substrate-binding protein
MNRRSFIAGLGSAAAWPLVARATQETRNPVRIGFLYVGSQSNAHDQALVKAFRQGLAEAGLVEGRDIVLDLVWVGMTLPA